MGKIYKVLKVLNNNTILTEEENIETIVIDKGIGFGKKENDYIKVSPCVKKYQLKGNLTREKEYYEM